MAKLKKGDEVIVLSGKDRGARGTVLRVGEDDRVLVEGINLVKKHMKPNPQAGVAGGIVTMEKPVHVSNLGIYNPQTAKADRVGYKRLEDSRKVRIFKGTGEVIAL
ncbi:MAG: 50S ribosomal protein L24 [Gammaproteobacteria bacterium]